MGLCGGVCQYVVHFAHVLHIVHIVAHSTSFYNMPCSSLTSPRVRYGCSRGGGVAQSLAVRDQVVCGRLSPHNHTTTTWISVWTLQYLCVALVALVWKNWAALVGNVVGAISTLQGCWADRNIWSLPAPISSI